MNRTFLHTYIRTINSPSISLSLILTLASLVLYAQPHIAHRYTTDQKRTPTLAHRARCSVYTHIHMSKNEYKTYINTLTYKQHHTLLCIFYWYAGSLSVFRNKKEFIVVAVVVHIRIHTHIYFFHFNTISIFNLLISFHFMQ